MRNPVPPGAVSKIATDSPHVARSCPDPEGHHEFVIAWFCMMEKKMDFAFNYLHILHKWEELRVLHVSHLRSLVNY